jgi:hypothetical protein
MSESIAHLRTALELLHVGGGHRYKNAPADDELIALGYAELFVRTYRADGMTKTATMVRATDAGHELVKDRVIFTDVHL